MKEAERSWRGLEVPARANTFPRWQRRLGCWESERRHTARLREARACEDRHRSWKARERKLALQSGGRWILASFLIGQGLWTFKRVARRGAPLCCLCQLPIHRKPVCQPSCPPTPAQRCQGTRHSKASWQLVGEPVAQPASHLLLTASCVPVGGGPAAHPSGRGASHWVFWASWQAGRTGQHTYPPASAR